jgi:hypothetical protein
MVYELVAEAVKAKRCGFNCQQVSCQRSAEALPSDCFDYAPEWGNYLQTPAAWPFAMFSHEGEGPR